MSNRPRIPFCRALISVILLEMKLLASLSLLALVSCSATPGTARTGPNKSSTPPKSSQNPTPGKQAIKGLNKTVNNINRVGGTIRNYQAIQSLF